MYGVTVFTWGTEQGTNKYLTPVTRVLARERIGHTAMSLVIPDTPENRKLVDEANKEHRLSVNYREILVRTDKGDDKSPPKAEKRGAIEIYFSFWPKLPSSPGYKHGLKSLPQDQVAESPRSLTAGTGREIQFFISAEKEKQEVFQKLFSRVVKLEKEKKDMLEMVEKFSTLLNAAKTDAELKKANEIIDQELKSRGIESFEVLEERFGNVSRELEACYHLLKTLQTSPAYEAVVGAYPDASITLPIRIEGDSNSLPVALDYRAILQTMGSMANDPSSSYNLFTLNCAAAATKCVSAGIPQISIDSQQPKPPSPPGDLIATPIGAAEYMCRLQDYFQRASAAPAEELQQARKSQEESQEQELSSPFEHMRM